jgi:zinc protease
MYGDHPAGACRSRPDGLEKVTRTAMVDFHRTRYGPDHAALAISGDISLAEARKLVEAKLGGWKKAGARSRPRPSPRRPAPPRCRSSVGRTRCRPT